jgi:hypothetical protein
MNYADIDIDLKDRSDLLAHVKHVTASIAREHNNEKHNSGVYFQPVPVNPLQGIASVDHIQAAELGYFKIDLLNNSVYQDVQNEEHLNLLIDKEPDWNLLSDPDVVKHLFHLSQHVELTCSMKPSSVDQLAMLLALIRPGKSYLRYQSWHIVKNQVWQKPQDGYYFKKSHSYAFALAIVVQLNLIAQQNDN